MTMTDTGQDVGLLLLLAKSGYTDARFGVDAKPPADPSCSAAYLWGYDAWRQAWLTGQDDVRREADGYNPEVGRQDRRDAAHRSANTIAYLRETGQGLMMVAQEGYTAARLDNLEVIRDFGDPRLNEAFEWGFQAWRQAYWYGKDDASKEASMSRIPQEKVAAFHRGEPVEGVYEWVCTGPDGGHCYTLAETAPEAFEAMWDVHPRNLHISDQLAGVENGVGVKARVVEDDYVLVEFHPHATATGGWRLEIRAQR